MPGVIVLGGDGLVRSLTDQARFWLEQFPADRGTGLQLPVAVHALAQRVLAPSRPELALPPYASVRLASGQWLTLHAAPLHADGTDPGTVAVTLAPAELEPLRLALYGLTPRARSRPTAHPGRNQRRDRRGAMHLPAHRQGPREGRLRQARVGSRAELSAKLFYQHIAPQIDHQRIRELSGAGLAS